MLASLTCQVILVLFLLLGQNVCHVSGDGTVGKFSCSCDQLFKLQRLVKHLQEKSSSAQSGKCDVSLRACGIEDAGDKTVYMKVNGVAYLSTLAANHHYRGFNLLALNPHTWKASGLKHFDTHFTPAESNNLANYINSLPLGTHILGVTSDEASDRLQPIAKNALKALDVDISMLRWRDKVLFYAVKGKPEKTFMKFGKMGENCLVFDGKAQECQYKK